MRLVRRLTIYLLIPIGLVFALDTFLTLRADLALLDADMRRDEDLLAHALATAVGSVWRQQGEDSAATLASRFPARPDGIEVRIVRLDATAPPRFAPSVAAARTALTAKAPTLQVRAARDGAQRLFTYVALDVPPPERAALEISEPLSHERALLAARIPKKLVTAASLALLCGGVAWVVGTRVVGRPVDALIAKARRIGTGDFSVPLLLPGHSELSSLAGEMNAMAEQLDASTRRIASESAARIAALEQLRHADRLTTVGVLTAGLAHELGTPLNVVAGRAQMIASGEIAEGDEVQRAARVIGDQAERMAHLVRQLLDFARSRGGTRQVADLTKLAKESVGFLAPLAKKRGVQLTCEGDAAITARLDASQIQQALANLVMNAIQASRAGGTVEVRVTETVVTTALRPDQAPGRHAVVEVEDHGEGIPADALHGIFDPFFTTKPVGEGTGLGLAVVYGILREHGGWIEVCTEPGSGTCFRAFVPS